MADASGECCSVIISVFEILVEIGVLTEICESSASGSRAADNFRILPASTGYQDWDLRSETSPRQRDEDEFLCIPAYDAKSYARLRQREVHCAKYEISLGNRYSLKSFPLANFSLAQPSRAACPRLLSVFICP